MYTTCKGNCSPWLWPAIHFTITIDILSSKLCCLWFEVPLEFWTSSHGFSMKPRVLLLCLWCLRRWTEQSFCLNLWLINYRVCELWGGARIKWRRNGRWEAERKKWKEGEMGDGRRKYCRIQSLGLTQTTGTREVFQRNGELAESWKPGKPKFL